MGNLFWASRVQTCVVIKQLWPFIPLAASLKNNLLHTDLISCSDIMLGVCLSDVYRKSLLDVFLYAGCVMIQFYLYNKSHFWKKKNKITILLLKLYKHCIYYERD